MKKKQCTQCKTEFPATVEFFSFHKRGRDGLFSLCRDCNRKNNRDWWGKNKEKHRKRVRKNALLRNYGITLEDYDKIYTEQNGCCSICGAHQSELSHTLGVDHSHTTGKVRGLLCTPCNTKLSAVEDIDWVDRAETYLALYQ